jgi:large subunit ribosomal protein L4
VAETPVAQLYTNTGDLKGEVSLDPEIFGIEPNHPVMHQVVTAQLAAARAGTASTKTRSDVRGGGRKPWRQKGLGRARQGSIRAPHWVGGGVVFGPHPRSYRQRTPKKMRRLALRSALSARASEGAIKVVETLEWAEPKTKTAKSLLEAIGAEGKTLVVLSRSDRTAQKSFRNLRGVAIVDPGQINTYDVLWSDVVVFTTDTVGSVAGRDTFEVTDQDFVPDEGGEDV